MFCPSEGDLIIDDTHYTLYDARSHHEASYHLYPRTDLFANAQAPGISWSCSAPGCEDELCIVVAERGSASGGRSCSRHLVVSARQP